MSIQEVRPPNLFTLESKQEEVRESGVFGTPKHLMQGSKVLNFPDGLTPLYCWED